MNQQMIKAAQEGDVSAVNQLCTDLYDPLRKQCAKLLKGKLKYDREDVLHESMIVIVKKLREFNYNSDKQFLSWCQKITFNTCLPYIKKDDVITYFSPDDLPELAAPEYIESSLGCEAIAEVISQLPPGASNNANLFFIEGHDHEEIGEILGIKVSTSTSTISRVRPVLQQLLSKIGFYGK